MLNNNNPKYITRYYFRVIIVLSIPTIYVIYSLFVSNYIALPLIMSAFLYLLTARNVKKGVFFEDYIIIYFPFKVINKQKKIAHNDITKIKRASSYYGGESLVIYFMKSNKQKRIVLGYPSERNKVGIINILENYDVNIDEFY